MQNHSTEVTNNIQASLQKYLGSHSYSKIAVLVDENTERHCLPKILDVLPEHYLIKIQSGEENKNLITCEDIWMAMTQAGFDRKGLLINLGGGVIGDMGGFAASAYKRGFDFVNIPTTLLSQVDASVGGKLGIDFHGFKNHIGFFKEPKTVLIYTGFFDTLPERELRSGFAEVIKHGLIYDASYWSAVKSLNYLETNWTPIVEQSIEIKKKVVMEDPFESGLRKILNFGHTIGHAVESFFLEKSGEKLFHGEAIAVGMICEAYLSKKLTGLSVTAMDDIVSFLIKIYQPKPIDSGLFDEILALTHQDKKNEGGIVQFSLLKDIGDCTINVPISSADMVDSLFFFNQRATK